MSLVTSTPTNKSATLAGLYDPLATPPAPELEEETTALAEVLPEREPSRLAARSHGTRSRNLEPPLPIHALRTETVRAPLPPAQPELNLQFE